MNRLNKFFTNFIITISLIIPNAFVFAETIHQHKDLKDSEKFDPESSNFKGSAEIVPPEILDDSLDDAILKEPPETGDKNKIIPDNKIDPGILRTPSDSIVK